MGKVQFGYVLLAPNLTTPLWVKYNDLDTYSEIVVTTESEDALIAGECINDKGIIDNFIQTAGIQIDELFSVGNHEGELGSSYIGIRQINE